jgi:hypothetical protein
MCAALAEGDGMKARRNPILLRTLAELKAAGAEWIEHWHGGKHIRVSATYNGRKVTTTIALSPRNPWRAARNHAAQTKRMLRDASATSAIKN